MNFEVKVRFDVRDLPGRIVNEIHAELRKRLAVGTKPVSEAELFVELVKLHQDSEPIVIDGIAIRSADKQLDLVDINLLRVTDPKDIVKELYVNINKLRGDAVPGWLNAMPSTKYSFGPIEFLKDLGIVAKIGPSPHDGGSEITGYANEWCKVQLLFALLAQINRGQKCELCGTTITSPSGRIIIDPNIKVCLSRCTEG